MFIKLPKLNLDKRAFSVTAPSVWNELPINLKSSDTIATFHKNSRHLFQIVFPPYFFDGPLL